MHPHLSFICTPVLCPTDVLKPQIINPPVILFGNPKSESGGGGRLFGRKFQSQILEKIKPFFGNAHETHPLVEGSGPSFPSTSTPHTWPGHWCSRLPQPTRWGFSRGAPRLWAPPFLSPRQCWPPPLSPTPLACEVCPSFQRFVLCVVFFCVDDVLLCIVCLLVCAHMCVYVRLCWVIWVTRILNLKWSILFA